MERRYGNMREKRQVTAHVKDGFPKAKKQFTRHSCPLDECLPALAALALHRIVPKRNDPNAVRRRRTLRWATVPKFRGKVVHLPPIDRKIIHEAALRTMEEELLRIILVPEFLRPSLGKPREALPQCENLLIHRIGHDAHIRKPLTGLPPSLATELPSPLLLRR